jgi:hypothetical protein
VPWLLLGCAALAVLPEDLGPVLAKLSASEDAREAWRGAQKADKLDDECAVLAARKTIWMLATAATLARAFLAAAFQTTAALVLSVEFLFSGDAVLLFAGSSFACGLFVVPLIVIARTAAGLNNAQVGTCATICLSLAAAMLFRPLLVMLESETSGMWLAFAALTVAVPAAHVMSGIMEGIALQQAVPESAMNQENLITADLVLQDALVRVIGPPSMMCLYAYGGRNFCAVALLIVAGLTCAGSYTARSALAIASSGDLEITSAEKKMDIDGAESKAGGLFA